MWNERYSFLRIELSQICNLNLIPELGMRFYLLRQRASSWPRPGESMSPRFAESSKQERARKNFVPKMSREIADFRSIYCGWDNGTMGQIVNSKYHYSPEWYAYTLPREERKVSLT